MNVTQQYLKEALIYSPSSGEFVWKKRPLSHFKSSRAHKAWNSRLFGKRAEHLDSRGHLQIKINGKKYGAHRLAFLYVTGSVPKTVDHIDRNKTNNAFENLRECNRSQNAANRSAKGVYLTKSKKWRAQICVNYKIKHLGTFLTKNEAESTYRQAHKKYFEKYSIYFSP